MNFLILLATASFVCIGIWNAFAKGMILGWLGDILERRLPEAINKPLWLCLPCMASVHGTILWFLAEGGWVWWIPFILALSGLNTIVSRKLLQ